MCSVTSSWQACGGRRTKHHFNGRVDSQKSLEFAAAIKFYAGETGALADPRDWVITNTGETRAELKRVFTLFHAVNSIIFHLS